MNDSEEIKEWFTVRHAATGQTVVTCTLTQGSLSVKWSTKTYPAVLVDGVAEARRAASTAMTTLRQAIKTLDDL